MSNPKIEKNMQKNNNAQAFTVENIVNKYINTENQYNPSIVGSGFEYCGGDELIAQLYQDVAGDNADVNVLSAILCNGEEFYDVALSNEEYEYLKEHFAETVEYVISTRAALSPAVHEAGQLPNDAAAFIVRMLNIPKDSTVFLPNAGYGDAIMLLRDCNISGYVHSKYAWAITQIRLYAAGIMANIECLDSAYYNKDEDVKHPTFPAKGTVDVIITSHSSSLYRAKYICKESVLFDCLKEDGQMVMLVSGRTLCGYISGISKNYLTNIIQFPCALRTGYDFSRRNHCALVYDKKKSSADTTYDFVDLTSLSMEFDMPELGEKWAYGAMAVTKALEIFNTKHEYVKRIEAKDLDEKILLPAYYFVNKSKFCHSICKEMTLANYEMFVDDGTNLTKPVVRETNLSKDFANASIQVESLKTAKETRNRWTGTLDNCIIVHHPCLFVCVKTNDNSNDITVGYIKDVPPTGIVVEGDIMCLVPRKGVSLETAALIVLSELVQKQLKAIPFVFQFRNEMEEFLPKIVVWPEVYDDNLVEELELEDMMEELQGREPANELDIEATIVRQQSQGQEHLVESISLDDDSSEPNECVDDDPYEPNECMDDTEEVASFDDFLNAMDKDSLIELIKNQMAKENEMRKRLIDSVKKKREEIKKSQEEFEMKFAVAKAEYMDEVRSRKHDMMPHIKQIIWARKNLDYYMLHKDSFDKEECYGGMKEEVENIKNAVESLSTYMEIFSREEKFGTPEVINIDQFLIEHFTDGKSYVVNHDTDYHALSQYGFDVPELLINPLYMNGIRKKALQDFQGYAKGINIFMAKDDLMRLCENIIGNAIKHGFTDPERKDYSIVTKLSVDKERRMFRIDFRNNGNPLPTGLDKQRYGLRGEKAGITGGTGEGGYIVKSIVEHYKGDYDIFCDPSGDEFLTTVRIFLPIF